MPRFQSPAWRIAYTIGVIVFGFTLFLAVYLTPPGNITNTVNYGDVSLTVEQPVLIHRWQCTHIHWSVEGIEKVYFDDQPGIGQQTVTYCPYAANNPDPLLYIDFQGEFIQTFSLPIIILTETVWFWTGVGLIVLFAVPVFLPLSQPSAVPAIPMSSGMSRRRFLLTGIAATVALVSLSLAVRRHTQSTEVHDGWLLKSNEVR